MCLWLSMTSAKRTTLSGRMAYSISCTIWASEAAHGGFCIGPIWTSNVEYALGINAPNGMICFAGSTKAGFCHLRNILRLSNPW